MFGRKKKRVVDDRMALLINPRLHKLVKLHCKHNKLSIKGFVENALHRELTQKETVSGEAKTWNS